MSDKFNHADMIGRYVRHCRKLLKGSDGLSADGLPPFSASEIAEMRRLAGSSNATASTHEKVGGVGKGERPPNGWFSNSAALRGLPGHE
jgi:hypothetical protein